MDYVRQSDQQESSSEEEEQNSSEDSDEGCDIEFPRDNA